tara:strand:- start:182 stop:334 length:153 start_codon:yes stop_codon:yes gene_type:complete
VLAALVVLHIRQILAESMEATLCSPLLYLLAVAVVAQVVIIMVLLLIELV